MLFVPASTFAFAYATFDLVKALGGGGRPFETPERVEVGPLRAFPRELRAWSSQVCTSA